MHIKVTQPIYTLVTLNCMWLVIKRNHSGGGFVLTRIKSIEFYIKHDSGVNRCIYYTRYVSVELIKAVRLPLRGIKWAVKLTRTNFIIQTVEQM